MAKKVHKITESELKGLIKNAVKNVLKESYASVFDEDYEEIIPLHDIFTNGFTFDEYYREKILLDTSLCDKNGKELGVCLNDLCLKTFPNKKR